MSSKEETTAQLEEEVDLDDLLDGERLHLCTPHAHTLTHSLVTDALDDFADEVSAAQASEMSNVKQEAAATAAATQGDEDNKMQEVGGRLLCSKS